MNERAQRAEVQDISDQDDQHPPAYTPVLSARSLTHTPHTVLASPLVAQKLCLASLFDNQQKKTKQPVFFSKVRNSLGRILNFAKVALAHIGCAPACPPYHWDEKRRVQSMSAS
jgi:hypothetical protein